MTVKCRKCGKLFNNPNSCGIMLDHYNVCKEKQFNMTSEREELIADYNELTKIVESKRDIEADKMKFFLLFSRRFDLNATENLRMTNEENLKDATTRNSSTKLSNQIERPDDASDTSFLERCQNIKKKAEIKNEDKQTMNSHIEPLKQDNRKSNSNTRADTEDVKMGSLLGICKANNNTETRNSRIQCKLCGSNTNDIFDAMQHKCLHNKLKTQEESRKPARIDERSKQNKEPCKNGDVINRQTQNCKPHGNSFQKHKNQKQDGISPVIQHHRRNSSELPTVRSPPYGTGTRNYRSSSEPNSMSRTTTVPQKKPNEISKNRVRFDTGNKRIRPTVPNGNSAHSATQGRPSKQRQATGSFPFRYDTNWDYRGLLGDYPGDQNFQTYSHRVQLTQQKYSQPLKSILKKSASYPADTLPNESPYLNAPIRKTSSVSDIVYTSQNQSQLDRGEKLSPNHLPSEGKFHEFSDGHCRKMKTQSSVGNKGVRFQLPSPLKQKNSPYHHKSPDENEVNFSFQEKLPIKTKQQVNNNIECQQMNKNDVRNTMQEVVRENRKPVQSAPKSNENVPMKRKRSFEEEASYHPQKIQRVAAGISNISHGFSKNANTDDADRRWPFNVNSRSPSPPEGQNKYNNRRVNQCNGTISSSVAKPLHRKTSPLIRSPNEYIKTNGNHTRSEDWGQKSQTIKPKQCTKRLSPTEKPHHHRQSPPWARSQNHFNTKVNQQRKKKSEMKSPPSLTAQIDKSVKPAHCTKLQSPLCKFPLKNSRNPTKSRIVPWFSSSKVNLSKNPSNQQNSDISPASLTAQTGKSVKPAEFIKLQLGKFTVKTSRIPTKSKRIPRLSSTEVNLSKNPSNQQKSDQARCKTPQNHRAAQDHQSSNMDKGLTVFKSLSPNAADREVTVIGQLPQCRASVSTDSPKSIFDNCPLRSSTIPKPQISNYKGLRVQIPNVLEQNLVGNTIEKKAEKRKIDQIEERHDLKKRAKVISEKEVVKLAAEKPEEIKPTEPTKFKEDQSPDQNKEVESCSSKDNDKIVHNKSKSKEKVVSPKENKVTKHSNAEDAEILYQHKKFSKLSVQIKLKESQIKVCHASPVVEKSRSPWDDLCWNSTKEPVNHATTKSACAAKIQNTKKIGIDTDPVEKNVINSSSSSSGSKIGVVRSSSPKDSNETRDEKDGVVRSSSPKDSNETRDEKDSAYTSARSNDNSPISNIVQSVINSQERSITSSPEYQTNTKVSSEEMTQSQPIIRKRRATARKSIRSSIRQQPNAIINTPVDTSNSTCICHVCKKTVPSSQKELYLHWSESCSKTSDTQML